mgnify:CR=1 FL=1
MLNCVTLKSLLYAVWMCCLNVVCCCSWLIRPGIITFGYHLMLKKYNLSVIRYHITNVIQYQRGKCTRQSNLKPTLLKTVIENVRRTSMWNFLHQSKTTSISCQSEFASGCAFDHLSSTEQPASRHRHGLVALLCYFPHEDLDCSSSTQRGDNIYQGAILCHAFFTRWC